MSRIFLYACFLVAAANAQVIFNRYKYSEMAPYSVAKSSAGKPYEKRYYAAQQWVSTKSWYSSFWKLYRYITGNNAGRQSIKMTTPVITKYETANSYVSNSGGYETSFYIPSIFQGRAPAPLARPDVYLQEIGPLVVYARKYAGWSDRSDREREYRALLADLRKDGVLFDAGYYYSAGYDGPGQSGSRRNEVWVIGKAK